VHSRAGFGRNPKIINTEDTEIHGEDPRNCPAQQGRGPSTAPRMTTHLREALLETLRDGAGSVSPGAVGAPAVSGVGMLK
jgi:hypothetical protein